MPDKTKTIVVFESHEQIIIRRSRRTVSGQVVVDDAEARLGLPEPGSTGWVRRGCFGIWWRRVALKGATVLAPWSRRLKAGTNKRGTKQR
jgi:hypothetical protein